MWPDMYIDIYVLGGWVGGGGRGGEGRGGYKGMAVTGIFRVCKFHIIDIFILWLPLLV